MKRFLLFLLVSFAAHAGLPVDIVFDIDLTIATMIDHGDPLGGPGENVIAVGKERYRIFEGMTDLMQKLNKDPRVRVSFFSGGPLSRNEELLRKIRMKDGSSLWELIKGRVLSRSDLSPTGLGPEHRFRHRFKKDLTKVNPDLSDVIIIDDAKELVPENQLRNLFYIGEDFPFPDRSPANPAPDPEVLAREKNKFQWISAQLDRALEERFRTGHPLSEIIQKITDNHRLTPFSANWSIPGVTCDVGAFDRLLSK